MKQVLEAPAAARERRRHIVWVLKKYFDHSLDQITWVAMVRELSRRHDVTLVTTYREHQLHYDGVRIVYLPTIKIRYLNHITFLVSLFAYLNWRFIKRIPDIVILDYSSCWAAMGRMILSKLGWLPTKFFLDIRTVPVELTGLRQFVEEGQYHAAIRLAKRLMSGITTVVEPIREEIVRRFNVPEKMVEAWGAGADPDLFNPKNVTRPELSQELGLKGKFVFMYHGLYSVNRGLDAAIRALALIKDSHPDIVLFFLGEGDVEPQLRSLADEMGLSDRVIFHPPVSNHEVINYIHMADVGLLPFPDIYWWRVCSPLKLMESLSMEKPVLATDIKGLRDILVDESFSFLANPATAEGIADGMRRAWEARGRLQQLGVMGRRHILSHYTFAHQAARFQNFLIERSEPKHPPRLAWFVKSYLDVNVSRVSRLEMGRALSRQGWEVDLVANYRHEPRPFGTPRPVRYLPSIHITFLDSLTFSLLAVFEVARQVFGRRANVLMLEPNLVFFTLPFNILRRLGLIGADFIMDVRTVPVDRVKWMGRINDFSYRLSVAFASRTYQGITVITPMMRADIASQVDGHPVRVAEWSSGANLDLFDPEKVKPVGRPFPEDMNVFLYPGVLTPYRGLQDSLRALALFNSRGHKGKLALWYIGDGDAKEELEALARELGIEECVRFDPPVPYDAMPAYAAAADACILSYPNIRWWRVSSPLKLMEFLAMNKPIVATRIDAHLTVMGEDYPGVLYIDSHDPADQARAFEEWFTRRDEIRLGARQGRDLVRARFSWDRQAEGLSRFLLRLEEPPRYRGARPA